MYLLFVLDLCLLCKPVERKLFIIVNCFCLSLDRIYLLIFNLFILARACLASRLSRLLFKCLIVFYLPARPFKSISILFLTYSHFQPIGCNLTLWLMYHFIYTLMCSIGSIFSYFFIIFSLRKFFVNALFKPLYRHI